MRAVSVANLEFEGYDKLFFLKEDDPLDFDHMPWLTCDEGRFCHIVRHSLRLEQWSELRYRRNGFKGIENGIDRAGTLELYKQLGGLHRYILRCILCGGVSTNTRLHRTNQDISRICPCCGQAEETVQHVFDECERHASQRLTEITAEDWAALPECLRLHGLMPADFLAPGNDDAAMNRKTLACLVQHNLLDIWEHRQTLVPGNEPQPRWQEARPGTSARERQDSAQERHRNVRARTERTESTQRNRRRERDDEPQRAGQQRTVRARVEVQFQSAGNLVTGENWRQN